MRLLKQSRPMAIGLLILNALVCWGQSEQAAITGVVTDQSGAAAPNTKVSAINANTQVAATTETNAQGNYKIPYLLPGTYIVTAEKAGFSQARVTNIDLPVGLTATINIVLHTGEVHTEVTVTANTELLDLQSST